jgi:hypothetical protein
MTQPRDLLARAAHVLRTESEPGWDAIADRVIASVRATPRPGGQPLLADGPGGDESGYTYVSDHVVRSTLVVALRQRFLCAPTAIDFDTDGTTLRGVHLQITGSYGTELPILADHIRATTLEIITDILGPTRTGDAPIDITITDVVTGDPLLS